MGDMIDYIKSKGIEHNPTAAHSSQSNGIAERINRTLFDMVCHINKKTGCKKLHKKSMLGYYLVGYNSMGIYRIYHPSTKKIKVSRDVIFSEEEFIGLQWVNNGNNNILSSENDVDDSGSESSDHDE